jgi:hypothetical protein
MPGHPAGVGAPASQRQDDESLKTRIRVESIIVNSHHASVVLFLSPVRMLPVLEL